MTWFFRSSKAKSAALSAITPFVEKTRVQLGHIPDYSWRRPYMIGFVTTLITLIAQRRAHGSIDSDQLALVQLETWMELTQLADDQIGEDIQILSASNDPAFVSGCENAVVFCRVFYGDVSGLSIEDLSPTEIDTMSRPFNGGNRDLYDGGIQAQNGMTNKAGELTFTLWEKFFNERLKD